MNKHLKENSFFRKYFTKIAILSGKLSVGLGFGWLILKIIFSAPGAPVQKSLPTPVTTRRSSSNVSKNSPYIETLGYIEDDQGLPLGIVIYDSHLKSVLLDVRTNNINPNPFEFFNFKVLKGQMLLQGHNINGIRCSRCWVAPNLVLEPVNLCLSREDYALGQLQRLAANKPLNPPSEDLQEALNRPQFEQLKTDHFQLFQWLKWYTQIDDMVAHFPMKLKEEVTSAYLHHIVKETDKLIQSIQLQLEHNSISFEKEEVSNFYYHQIYSSALEAYDLAAAEAAETLAAAEAAETSETQIIPTADEISEGIAAEADATMSRMDRLKRNIGISTLVAGGIGVVGRVLLWLI